MSNPATYNITITQGETYSLTLTAQQNSTAMDLTGYIAKSEVRELYDSVHPALTFSVSSGLGPNGVIALSATTASTVALNANKKYKWDCIIYSGSSVTPIVRGEVTVVPRTTRL